MRLTEQIATMARTAGASLVGIAAVERFEGAPRGHHPVELLPGARAVVSFGVRLLDRVLAWPELLRGSELIPEEVRIEALDALFYGRSGYDIVNDRLDQIALTLANYLEDQGYPSLFFPSTYGNALDKSKGAKMAFLPGMFSQRHAAVRAGLGEFGLNNVVVTERYGPRIRFGSVITAAPLEASPLLAKKLCPGESCNLCVARCEAGALTLLPEARERRVWLLPVSRTDWATCREKRVVLGCKGRCLRVCPVGQRIDPAR